MQTPPSRTHETLHSTKRTNFSVVVYAEYCGRQYH